MSNLGNISALFKKLKKTSTIHSVPTLYGTKRWPSAAIAELGPKVDISPSSGEHVRIQFPGTKHIEVSNEEFWEISCLSSCEKHNAYYFDDKADIWLYERPWQALQEYNLMHCRENLRPEQEELTYKILNAYSKHKHNIPFLASLTYGWPWMFENSPGVWPPAEIINPRSCLYDPVLGILMFQDILQYVEGEGGNPLTTWSLELSLCLAAHNTSAADTHTELAKEALRAGSHEDIQSFVETIEALLIPFHSQFDVLLEDSDPEYACLIFSILLLGASRWLDCRLPFPKIAKTLRKNKLLQAYRKLEKNRVRA